LSIITDSDKKGIELIRSDELDVHLEDEERQYLVGDLKLPQRLAHIKDDNVEVGISYYKEFKADEPHVHLVTTEYQYMLEGYSEFLNLETNEVTRLYAGDFFIVHKNTRYVQKSSKGTKILFFKTPSGNDKEYVTVSEKIKKWLHVEI